MRSERWKRLEELFDGAADLPSSERQAFLDETCPDDPDLRAKVEELLDALPDAEQLFGEPAVSLTGPVGAGKSARIEAGVLVGHYRILRELGRGGMGVVFLAERADGEYDQLVAVKFVTAGILATDLLDRLRAERQILAKLAHPNIARLLDGGTTSEGAPYVVMEYVDGRSIDQYADEEALDLNARVDLLTEVCAAVEHAHEQGIIHRDIKPGNILVTAAGRPKLLDFGIAKALAGAQERDATRTVARRLTPEYASPEQIQGGPLSPATDVYALGAVLYRLLTGTAPHRVTGVSLLEMERIVCSELPDLPSSRLVREERNAPPDSGGWSRRLRGDLDNIVRKALHHDPDRRYARVRELADDLARHRTSLPVSARSDSAAYRASKFWKRHRSQTVLAAIAVAAIAAVVLNDPAPPPARPVEFVPDRIAVGVFANETGDPGLGPLGTMAMDWIVDGLASTGVVEVVPAVVSVAVHELAGGEDVETPFAGAATRIALETGAATVVSGAMYAVGDSIEFRTRVTDSREGTLLRVLDPIRTPRGEGLKALGPLRQQVTTSLATVLNPLLADYAMVIDRPPTYEAYEAFVLGVEAYVRLDDEAALDYFRTATDLDRKYGSAHVASCLPLVNLGRIAEADSVARWVQDQGLDLAPLEQTSVDFILAYLQGDHELAYAAAVRGSDLAPTSILAYQAGRSALETRRVREAVDRMLDIDPARGWMNGWVSYWSILTQGYHYLGDHGQELEAARAGTAQYPNSMVALAAEVQAQAARGRLLALRPLLSRASELEPQLAWTAERIGITAIRELRAHGHRLDLRLALSQLQKTLAGTQIPTGPGQAFAFALAYYEAADWKGAQDVLLGIQEPRAPVQEMRELALSALISVRLSEDDGADIASALEDYEAPYSFGENHFWSARIHAVAGRAEEATASLRAAHAAGLPATLEIHREQDFTSLRGMAAFRATEDPVR